LFNVLLMHQLEFLLHSLYIFFTQTKKFAKFQKLAVYCKQKATNSFEM
jgi:hypothetical protein